MEWKRLPDLLRRRDVLALGIPDEVLAAVCVEVQDGAEVAGLPPRTIACIRPMSADGRPLRRFYFKQTVAAFRAR